MRRRHSYRKLTAVTILLAGIWLIVLPWLTDRPHTRRYLERLDASGIDPAAMYYTELPPHLFADAIQRRGKPQRPARNTEGKQKQTVREIE